MVIFKNTVEQLQMLPFSLSLWVWVCTYEQGSLNLQIIVSDSTNSDRQHDSMISVPQTLETQLWDKPGSTKTLLQFLTNTP